MSTNVNSRSKRFTRSEKVSVGANDDSACKFCVISLICVAITLNDSHSTNLIQFTNGYLIVLIVYIEVSSCYKTMLYVASRNNMEVKVCI